jgi:hypothetical protein
VKKRPLHHIKFRERASITACSKECLFNFLASLNMRGEARIEEVVLGVSMADLDLRQGVRQGLSSKSGNGNVDDRLAKYLHWHLIPDLKRAWDVVRWTSEAEARREIGQLIQAVIPIRMLGDGTKSGEQVGKDRVVLRSSVQRPKEKLGSTPRYLQGQLSER